MDKFKQKYNLIVFLNILGWIGPFIFGIFLEQIFGPATLIGCILTLCVCFLLEYLYCQIFYKREPTAESLLKYTLFVIGMEIS